MSVTYTPPLIEQIRGNRRRVETENARPMCIYIRSCSAYVMAVDPRTYQSTSDRQQFVRRAADGLAILPQSQWVESPDVLEVDSYSF